MEIELVHQRLKEQIPEEYIKVKVPMKEHTSFRIGGPADIMVLPDNAQRIMDTIEVCRSNNCPYYIMGNGTNLLVRDSGYRGVIIKTSVNMTGYNIEDEKVYGQSGVLLSTLSKAIACEGLEGFEYAGGIPGTLGGAVTMNAGAYGGEIKDSIEWAQVMDIEGNIKTLTKSQLGLEYRTSIVQNKDLIVLNCGLKFKKGNKNAIEKRIAKYTNQRRVKQPLNVPSAGSTFKRPEGYYAGKLIEDAGLKGFKIGGAQVSKLHCGFIINVGDATATDVIALIGHIKECVKERFDVTLQPEVKVIGEP